MIRLNQANYSTQSYETIIEGIEKNFITNYKEIE